MAKLSGTELCMRPSSQVEHGKTSFRRTVVEVRTCWVCLESSLDSHGHTEAHPLSVQQCPFGPQLKVDISIEQWQFITTSLRQTVEGTAVFHGTFQHDLPTQAAKSTC